MSSNTIKLPAEVGVSQKATSAYLIPKTKYITAATPEKSTQPGMPSR